MTILDTLIGQAKTNLSRAYLTTGIVPAASLLAGWRVYSRGLAESQADLKGALGNTSSWTSATIVAVLVLATVGGMFFVGRTLVLRVLQAVPGSGPASILRQHLLATQVSRWWSARRRKRAGEYRLTPLEWATARDFTEKPMLKTQDEVIAVAASKRARERLEWLVGAYPGGLDLESVDIDIVVEGLQAFYSLPGAGPADPGTVEREHWVRLIAARAGAADLLSRIRGELFRQLLDRTAETREQPDDERWLAPTRLGNRVAVLDDYAERRYGIGTSALWIRLWGVLEDKEKKEVTDSQLMVELLANLTAAFVLLALLIFGSSAWELARDLLWGTFNGDDWKAVAFIAGSLALARACYHTAVFAFGTVAERIIRLVDLQRLRLITGVGYLPPKTVKDELEIFQELNEFFAGAGARNPDRKLTAPPAPKTSAAGTTATSPLRSIKL